MTNDSHKNSQENVTIKQAAVAYLKRTNPLCWSGDEIDIFEAGALWERERCKVLVEALKWYQREYHGDYPTEVNRFFDLALKQYEAADD